MKHRNLLKSLTAVLLLFALVAIAVAAPLDRPRLFQRKAQQPPTAAVPMPAQGVFDGKVRQRIVLDLLHHRVVSRATKDGFKLIGGNDKPLTKEQAEVLYSKISEETIIAGMKEVSPQTTAKIGEGGFLANLIDWIATHQDQILAVAKFIMSLMALFGDGQVAVLLGDGGFAVVWPGGLYLVAY